MFLLKKINPLLILICLLGINSCSTQPKVEPPADLLEEETFVMVVAEFEIIQSLFNAYPDTARSVSARDSVLKFYNISLDQFYRSEAYYHEDVLKYQELLNKAMDKLNEDQSKLLDNQQKN